MPGLGGGDPRTTADPGSPPWSAVARLQVPGVSRCTAVMVAPSLAVTAAHCVYNRALQRVVPPGSVHLLLGYDAGAFTRHMLVDTIRLAPGADPAAPAARGSDLALLHVAAAVPDTLPILVVPLASGTAVQLGGFGQDRAERLVVDAQCRATGMVAGQDGRPLLRHDCSGTRGSSGGPVLVQVDGRWVLVGIEVAANAGGAGGLAVPGAAVAALMTPPLLP